jgi:hypothetical protein
MCTCNIYTRTFPPVNTHARARYEYEIAMSSNNLLQLCAWYHISSKPKNIGQRLFTDSAEYLYKDVSESISKLGDGIEGLLVSRPTSDIEEELREKSAELESATNEFRNMVKMIESENNTIPIPITDEIINRILGTGSLDTLINAYAVRLSYEKVSDRLRYYQTLKETKLDIFDKVLLLKSYNVGNPVENLGDYMNYFMSAAYGSTYDSFYARLKREVESGTAAAIPLIDFYAQYWSLQNIPPEVQTLHRDMFVSIVFERVLTDFSEDSVRKDPFSVTSVTVIGDWARRLTVDFCRIMYNNMYAGLTFDWNNMRYTLVSGNFTVKQWAMDFLCNTFFFYSCIHYIIDGILEAIKQLRISIRQYEIESHYKELVSLSNEFETARLNDRNALITPDLKEFIEKTSGKPFVDAFDNYSFLHAVNPIQNLAWQAGIKYTRYDENQNTSQEDAFSNNFESNDDMKKYQDLLGKLPNTETNRLDTNESTFITMMNNIPVKNQSQQQFLDVYEAMKKIPPDSIRSGVVRDYVRSSGNIQIRKRGLSTLSSNIHDTDYKTLNDLLSRVHTNIQTRYREILQELCNRIKTFLTKYKLDNMPEGTTVNEEKTIEFISHLLLYGSSFFESVKVFEVSVRKENMEAAKEAIDNMFGRTNIFLSNQPNNSGDIEKFNKFKSGLQEFCNTKEQSFDQSQSTTLEYLGDEYSTVMHVEK